MIDQIQTAQRIPAEPLGLGAEITSFVLDAPRRHLLLGVGLVMLTLHPARSAAQRYEPYLVENGAAYFVRPIDDSSVMSAHARFAPSGALVSFGVYFAHYILQCPPRDQRAYFRLGRGTTEQAALDEFADVYPLRQRRLAASKLPGDSVTQEEALADVGCNALFLWSRQRPSAKDSAKPNMPRSPQPSSPKTTYSLAWSDSGEAGFVRALTDSAVMVAFIQYTTMGFRTDLGIRFEQHVVHCGWKPTQPWESALISVGDSEMDALIVRTPSVGHFTKRLKVDALIASCLALRRWKSSR